MKSPLHILHLEDDPNDAKLVKSTLETGGIACATTRVQTHDAFVEALERGGIDLILSDFTLPDFDGLSALEIAHAKQPDLPVIFVSGTLGEERAIDSLKSGATDYVLKEGLSRLAPAVRRAMREVEERIERRRLEAQFIEGQKMDVIGQLSCGVAHDVNNILGIIIGNNDYVMGKLRADDPLRKNIEEIQIAAERAAAVTRQLLVFGRNQTLQPVVLDLNEVIDGLGKMLHQLIDEHIEMTVVHGKKLGRIKADSGYLGQLLMNLVINARDAMPEGGYINIETRNVMLDKNDNSNHVDVPLGDYVMLSVGDTGTGMTAEVKARLFEAFFTTKPKGKGTGLGLATCQTIVKQSNAHISVNSEPGMGTTFKVYFPRVEQPLHTATVRLPSGRLPRGTETLLLVEDEGALRRMTSTVLENQGYTVLQATSGQEGLRVAREHQGPPICLVITDVIMPQMGGKVMAEWLTSSFPDIKILFTSGYTDDSIAHQGVLEAGVEFLAKPYTSAMLTLKIREMLSSGVGTS